MSRKSLRKLSFALLWVTSLGAKEPDTTAVYIPFALYSSHASAKSDVVGWIRAQSANRTQEISAPSLKDYFAIRAEAIHLGARSLWIFQKSRGMESTMISAILMSAGDGRVLSESAFPSNDFSAFRSEMMQWLSRAVPEMENASLDAEPLIQSLVEQGRCDDLKRFLSDAAARNRCKGTKAFKALENPIRLSFRQVEASIKPIWIDAINDSSLIQEAQKILTKPGELRLECLDECKRGILTLTLYTTQDLLANEENPLQRLLDLSSTLLSYMEEGSKKANMAMDPAHLVLVSPSGFEMDMPILGTSKRAKLRPTQSIRSFLDQE